MELCKGLLNLRAILEDKKQLDLHSLKYRIDKSEDK